MKNIFKIASLLAAAVMLFSCEEIKKEGSETSMLSIVSDRDVIQSDGTDAAILKVMYGDKDVTAESVFYNENDEVLNLVDGKFTATKDGEYRFWAEYGTHTTFDKELDDNGLIVIKAISVPVPSVAADTEAANTSFVHRAFLTQYTATGCGYCPYMIKVLKELKSEEVIPAQAVLAAVHSGPYSGQDPAAISAPSVNSYPYLTVDFVSGFDHTQGSETLKGMITTSIAGSAKAGISVNPVYYPEAGQLVVTVGVKAAEDGIYNVGAWLLEDDIYGQQSDYDGIGDESYNTHENCVRLIDSRYDGEWAGMPVGALKAGETGEKTFVMKLKLSGSKPWKVENLHLAVIVSRGEKAGYTVCNAIDCPIDEPTPFEYR